MSSTRFFSILSGKHSHLCLDYEVIEFHGLNQISVPDVTSVTDSNILHFLRDLVQFVAALFEVVLSSEDSSILLHSSLHLESHLSSWDLSSGVSEFIEVGKTLLSGSLAQLFLRLTWGEVLTGGLSSSSSEDNQVEERVGSETVSSVNR